MSRLAYNKSQSKDNSILKIGIVALLVALFFVFRDKIVGMVKMPGSDMEVNNNREVVIKQEPVKNNLGMDIPKLSDLTNPIEWLRTNNPFKEISRTISESQTSSWLNNPVDYKPTKTLSDYNTNYIGIDPEKRSWMNNLSGSNPFGIETLTKFAI